MWFVSSRKNWRLAKYISLYFVQSRALEKICVTPRVYFRVKLSSSLESHKSMAVDLNLLMLLKNLLKWTEHGTISQNHCESRRQLSLLMSLFSPNSPFIYFSQHAYYNVKTNWGRQRDIFALYFGNIYFIVLHCTFSLIVSVFCLIIEPTSLIYSIYYSHNTTLLWKFPSDNGKYYN